MKQRLREKKEKQKTQDREKVQTLQVFPPSTVIQEYNDSIEKLEKLYMLECECELLKCIIKGNELLSFYQNEQ